MLVIIFYILGFIAIENFTVTLPDKQRIKNQTIWCYILLCGFFCFRGLPVLNDTSHYYAYQIHAISDLPSLKSIFDVEWDTSIEVGFQVLQHFIAKYISTDPYAIIMITALACSIGLVWFIRMYTDALPFTLFLLAGMSYLFSFYAAMRQSLAAILFFVAIYLWDKKGKKIVPIALIGLAWLFHDSVIVCLIPFVLSYFEVSKKNIIRYIVILTISVIALYPILEMLSYSDSMYVERALQRESPALAAFLNLSFYAILLIWVYLNHSKQFIIENKMLIWCGLTCIFFHLCALQILIFERFGLYFSIFVVLLFVKALYASRSKSTIKILLILVLLIRTFIVLEYRNEWLHLVPYSFYDFGDYYHQTDFGY